jgi:6,7-dimethyl-8-ribityllumazine synthase
MKIYHGKYSVKNKTFAVVVAHFNEYITRRLLDGALLTLKKAGVPEKRIRVIWVPGGLEVPFFCKKVRQQTKCDVVIALACVIRGGTYHFECVSHELTRGIAQVALESGVPIATGVITADNLEQAIDRAGLKAGNKGEQAALVALEIASLDEQLKNKKISRKTKRA